MKNNNKIGAIDIEWVERQGNLHAMKNGLDMGYVYREFPVAYITDAEREEYKNKERWAFMAYFPLEMGYVQITYQTQGQALDKAHKLLNEFAFKLFDMEKVIKAAFKAGRKSDLYSTGIEESYGYENAEVYLKELSPEQTSDEGR